VRLILVTPENRDELFYDPTDFAAQNRRMEASLVLESPSPSSPPSPRVEMIDIEALEDVREADEALDDLLLDPEGPERGFFFGPSVEWLVLHFYNLPGRATLVSMPEPMVHIKHLKIVFHANDVLYKAGCSWDLLIDQLAVDSVDDLSIPLHKAFPQVESLILEMAQDQGPFLMDVQEVHHVLCDFPKLESFQCTHMFLDADTYEPWSCAMRQTKLVTATKRIKLDIDIHADTRTTKFEGFKGLVKKSTDMWPCPYCIYCSKGALCQTKFDKEEKKQKREQKTRRKIQEAKEAKEALEKRMEEDKKRQDELDRTVKASASSATPSRKSEETAFPTHTPRKEDADIGYTESPNPIAIPWLRETEDRPSRADPAPDSLGARDPTSPSEIVVSSYGWDVPVPRFLIPNADPMDWMIPQMSTPSGEPSSLSAPHSPQNCDYRPPLLTHWADRWEEREAKNSTADVHENETPSQTSMWSLYDASNGGQRAPREHEGDS
jgi:hypothetical protein